MGFGKNSYYAMTLQHFGKIDTINIVLYNDYKEYPCYFPYYSKKNKLGEIIDYVEDLDMIEDSIDIKTDNCNHKGFISYLQIKANEINFNKKNDLGKAFNKFNTNNIIPFIKYKTHTNVYYKVDKEFIKNTANYEDYWTKWTELTGLSRKYPDTTSIIFKIYFMKMKNSFCSFRIYDDFTYDIKFSIGKANKTLMENITNYCDTTLNNILKEFRLIYPNQYIPDITKDMISIIDITSVDIISLEKKSIKYDSFEDIINQILFPYFNIIPTSKRNTLQLQYKKVDNYLKYDNITAFIMNKSNMPRDEIIQKLSKWFRITLSDAEKEYEKNMNNILYILKYLMG
jgi:hypothetical protein